MVQQIRATADDKLIVKDACISLKTWPHDMHKQADIISCIAESTLSPPQATVALRFIR